MQTKSKRRPSAAQRPIIAALVELGGVAVRHGDVVDRMTAWAGVGSWVAVESAGCVTVDRGTPDNRGGVVADYRYTLTREGWQVADVDEFGLGTTKAGNAWAAARCGAWIVLATSSSGAVATESAKGEVGARNAFRTIVDVFAPRGEIADAHAIVASCIAHPGASPSAVLAAVNLCPPHEAADRRAAVYDSGSDRYVDPDTGREDPGARARRRVEESSGPAFWGD